MNESFIHLGHKGFLGRRRRTGEQPYVDRYIDLINNTSMSERAVVHLSMNHSSIPASEDSPRGGQNLWQRTERTLGWRGRTAGGGKSTPPFIHLLYHEYRSGKTPRAEDYLVQRERRETEYRIKHHSRQ